jgi:hypothetical protein
MTRVGFTGTQVGMTGDQSAAVYTLLLTFKSEKEGNEFHHGGCVGADVQAAALARAAGYKTIRHPGDNPEKQDDLFLDDDYRVVLENLARNRLIVDETSMMIAAPKEDKEVLRSGTWATIRYARKVDKPLYVVQPSGLIL